jgi:hypothetical protein
MAYFCLTLIQETFGAGSSGSSKRQQAASELGVRATQRRRRPLMLKAAVKIRTRDGSTFERAVSVVGDDGKKERAFDLSSYRSV